MKIADTSYISLLNQLSDAVYLVDKTKTIIFWNKAAERITGYQAHEMLGRMCNGDIFQHVDKQGHALCPNRCPLATQPFSDMKGYEADLTFQHKDGYRFAIHTKITPAFDENHRRIGSFEIFQNTGNIYDYNKIKILAKIAYFDALTAMSNRQYAEAKLQTALINMDVAVPPGILLINIDDLKAINVTYGESAGDQALIVAARILLNGVDEPNIAARWQGTKFMILCYNGKKSLLLLIASKLKNLLLQSTFPVNDENHSLQVSIVGATAQPGDTPLQLIARADALFAERKGSEILVTG